jgi:hypothetical protein
VDSFYDVSEIHVASIFKIEVSARVDTNGWHTMTNTSELLQKQMKMSDRVVMILVCACCEYKMQKLRIGMIRWKNRGKCNDFHAWNIILLDVTFSGNMKF